MLRWEAGGTLSKFVVFPIFSWNTSANLGQWVTKPRFSKHQYILLAIICKRSHQRGKKQALNPILKVDGSRFIVELIYWHVFFKSRVIKHGMVSLSLNI